MIESFCIACIATLIKMFIDRETVLYRSWWEYFLFWIGAFILSMSAGIMSEWIRSVMR